MSTQPIFEIHFPVDRPLAWEDLQTIPDDQYHHYEIVDGALVVSPAPGFLHQTVVKALLRVLDDACPKGLVVLPAPFDFAPRPGLSLQPDVLVARLDDVGEQRIERPPALVVEVTSPSSRVSDRTVKREQYQAHGVPAYWIVDPDALSLTVLRLRGGRYQEVAYVVGDESYEAEQPFPVTVVPGRLVQG